MTNFLDRLATHAVGPPARGVVRPRARSRFEPPPGEPGIAVLAGEPADTSGEVERPAQPPRPAAPGPAPAPAADAADGTTGARRSPPTAMHDRRPARPAAAPAPPASEPPRHAARPAAPAPRLARAPTAPAAIDRAPAPAPAHAPPLPGAPADAPARRRPPGDNAPARARTAALTPPPAGDPPPRRGALNPASLTVALPGAGAHAPATPAATAGPAHDARLRAAPGDRASERGRPAQPEHIVHVTIGRLEVRAGAPAIPALPAQAAPRRSAAVALDDYLRERSEGRRR